MSKDMAVLCGTCGWIDEREWETEEEALRALIDHMKEHEDE